MPDYIFECENCGSCTEVRWLISEYDEKIKKHKCYKCKSKKVHRKYDADNIYSTVKDVKTIGQLADKNAKVNKTKIAESNHQKKESEPKPLTPWYRDAKYGTASTKEINKMSNEQKTKYIMEGR